MARILRPGLVLLRYVGSIAVAFRAVVEERKYIEIQPGDLVLTPAHLAVRLERGTQYERVESPVDLLGFLAEASDTDLLELADDDALMAELIERDIAEKADLGSASDDEIWAEAIRRQLVPLPGGVDDSDVTGDRLGDLSAAAGAPEESAAAAEKAAAPASAPVMTEADSLPFVLTKENLKQAPDKEIKRVLKNHKVKYGGKSREEIEALVVAFLD